MRDSFEPDRADSFEPEGGAEGGNEGPSKPLEHPTASAPADPAEEKRRMALAISNMTHGQNMAALSPEQRDAFDTKSSEKALGQVIAGARGVPLTGAHIDELSALLQTGKTEGPEYQSKLGQARQAVSTAVKDNPALPELASLAFAPALPPTAAGRLALATGSGLSEAMGAAPNMTQAKKDARGGATAGLLSGLFGEGLIQAGGGLNAAKASAVERNKAITDKTLEDAFGSARSKVGGETSAGTNAVRSAKEVVANEKLPENLRRAAQEWLDSEEALKLQETTGWANLGRGEDALPRIAKAKEALAEAGANLSPEARAAAAQKRLDDPSRLIRRLQELGPKIALPVLGGMLGGAEGAGAGALTSAVLGRSATRIRNAMTDPYVASRLGPFADTIEGGGRMTQASVPALSRWSKFLQPDEEQQ